MRTKFDKESKIFAAIAAVAVAGIIVVIVFATKGHNEWKAWCVGQGGRVVDDTKVSYTTIVNPNGTVGSGTTTTTTHYCLSPSGGIIDIE